MWSTPYWIPISTYVVVHTYILSTYCLQLDTLTLALLSYSLHWKSIYFYNTTFYTVRKKIPATLSTKYIITYLYTIQNYISYLLIYKPRTRLLLIVIILLTLLSKIIAKTLTRVALGWVKSRPDRAKSIQGTKLTRAFFRKTQGYLRIKQSAINCCGTIGRHPKI